MHGTSVRLSAACLLISAHLGAPCLAQATDERAVSSASTNGVDRTDLPALLRLYTTDREEVARFYDLAWSESRLDRLERLTRDWQARVSALPWASLDLPSRVDALLLRDALRGELRREKLERDRLAEMEPLLPIRRDIQSLESSRRALETLDSEAAAGRISRIKDLVKHVRERIEAGRKKADPSSSGDARNATNDEHDKKPAIEPLSVSPVTAARSARATLALLGTMRAWHESLAGYKPEFTWWTKRPFEEASAALEDYAKFLREDIAGLKGHDDDPLIGDPIGREALLAEMEQEVIAYTPEELIALGERELAWCQDRMKEASREMGLGDDWRAALDRVKADHVPAGEQDMLVAQIARDAIAFLKERDLVTIPPLCEETWRLSMLTPETQRSLPFAVYGGQAMLVAYPTDAMAHEDKIMSMRGNNRHFTRIVTPHELIPGHHLQGFMAARERPERQAFSTPFFVEGWALYWEMTLWDAGYPRSPEDRLGMLFWRAHRAARIVVSLKFHLGEMTPAQMVDFLVDRVGHERFGATSEVRRYIGGDYGPLYQAGYMTGGLQLRALRRELVDSGRMKEKAFHDALLTLGPIPIEYVRASMLGQDLAPDRAASWKFLDAAPGDSK
jgi:uncharacterized protein (DUF885 family)